MDQYAVAVHDDIENRSIFRRFISMMAKFEVYNVFSF